MFNYEVTLLQREGRNGQPRWRKNRRKQRSGPGGEWQGAPGKLSTLFSLGREHREPWLFMVPVRWKEGEKRAGGRACPRAEVPKVWGRGAPQGPPNLSEPRWRRRESPLLFIRSWKKGAKVRRAGKSQWMSAPLSGPSSFGSSIPAKELRALPPGGGSAESAQRRRRGLGGQGQDAARRRRFCHFAATLFPSLWDSWPPFGAAPPCLCWQGGKSQQDFCILHLGTLERLLQRLFSQKSWKLG